ncbi:MAG: hypothetical protein OIF57_04165 [Marinobacterium sp.]|nr:hypothetical protein [Marinobacterium sp.]
MAETTVTVSQALANLETALNNLLDHQDNLASGGAQDLIDQLKVQLTGTATHGTADTHQSLGMLQDQVHQLGADTKAHYDPQIQAVNDAITALDTTYATDSDLAARVQAVNEAMSLADDDLSTLVNERITTADAVAAIAQARQDAQSYADQKISEALTGIVAMLEARLASAGG